MKLTKGRGSPEKGGCWMVAASMYATGKWSDQPECVPPTIRRLCIVLNDILPDGEREAVIGPHLFDPMGRDSSPEAEAKRANMIADWAVEMFARFGWAKKWLSGEDRTSTSAKAANEAASVAKAAAYAAASAADAASVKEKQQICRSLMDLILRICQVGEKKTEQLDGERVESVMRQVCLVKAQA